MRRALPAGFAYFAVVFAIGFALGTARALLIAPRLGETGAVLLELPVMIAASWLVARWCVRRFAVPASAPSRLTMGAVAFGLLLAAEVGVSMLLAGRSFAEHLATYGRFAGQAGLAAQLVFAAMPWLQMRR